MYTGLVITSANGDVGIGESIKVLKNGGTALMLLWLVLGLLKVIFQITLLGEEACQIC